MGPPTPRHRSPRSNSDSFAGSGVWPRLRGLVIGAVAYNIYALYHPMEQFELDPEKKTLVILGTGWGTVSLPKKLDTKNYNVVVVSPRNYFLFTPLLPSCTTGLIEPRSIMEPIRSILRHKNATVKFYKAEATKIDYDKRVVYISDCSEIKGDTFHTEVPFDMLVVGGGPTGVEFAGELQDLFNDDPKKWVPEIEDNFHVTLVEALPNALPMFSKQLIDYTGSTFKEEGITIRAKTIVKKVTDKYIEAEVTKSDGSKKLETIPYGLLVWAMSTPLD
ncbi:uncharacterized protein CDV56_100168 [Aspergillus thermomutatus]|uniref:NADH:ubiquinone reductase (non-electrogenic) n=1 Tax=Aspergillus thermomutatus TaxID=41047 RepID=A0A397G8B5_ASPTH|nr:uncharacterized protein CDV56_100168 [Aspergillus thermomutatus]RHZ46114.1 hypothetical protein CDV56_100168 [Aspergillus thermomutatus]